MGCFKKNFSKLVECRLLIPKAFWRFIHLLTIPQIILLVILNAFVTLKLFIQICKSMENLHEFSPWKNL